MKFSCLGNIEPAINSLRNRRRILSKNVSRQTILCHIVPLQKLSILYPKNWIK